MKIADALRVIRKLEMETREGRDTVATFRHEGVVLTRTRVPHGRGELEGRLPSYIRQDLCLNEDEFRLVSNCTYWRGEYLKILQAKGALSSHGRPSTGETRT
ncbi:hypothetical protein FJY70_00465 [candidate division WOR-3 bacterium]|nr:hypothetical protein [candidate division WOR-3 bacterium]